MPAGIWTVFRKELVYTLRDRKTLAFMLLLPTLAIPLLSFGVSRIVLRGFQKRAVKTVRIAATAETHEAYRRLIHEWFLGTDMAEGLRLMTSPIMQALIRPEALGGLGELRPEVLADPAAFEDWTRQIVGLVREGIDKPAPRVAGVQIEVPAAVEDQALAYYQVVIKGLGLVEFVDPATLPDPPADFETATLPADVRAPPHAREIVAAIQMGTLHGYLEIPQGALALAQDTGRALAVTLLHDSSNDLSAEANWRVSGVVRRVSGHLVHKRLQARGLTEHFIEPLKMKPGTELATRTQRVLAWGGGILPLFVIVFALIGGMYPAIDLGAGEKERFTLETLLLSPVSRTEITLGKALVILLTSLVAAFVSLASLALSVKYLLPERAHDILDIHLDVGAALAAALLTIPPAVAFSGALLAVSIYARSFKEAQNYMTALLYLLMLPALAPMIPGLEINWKLAFVPLVNVSLLGRDFLKGSTHWGYYAATLTSCLAVAAVCMAYAIRQFRKEEVLFRS